MFSIIISRSSSTTTPTIIIIIITIIYARRRWRPDSRLAVGVQGQELADLPDSIV